MYNRRNFLKTGLAAGAGTLAFGSLPIIGRASQPGNVRLVILHTNDMHSHIDPFPPNDPKYPGLGGMSKRAALVKQLRAENDYVLLLDAGDVFQGTPYFNFFGGELEFKLMSEMGYDACAIGNHDFDNGIDGLEKMMPHAKFPFVCANYDFSNTVLNGKVQRHHIIERGPLRIGIVGVGVELNGLVDPTLYKETVYLNPIEQANQEAAALKNEHGCNLVICLSHLGYEYATDKVSDKVLAGASSHIDIIIGGHTHTTLDSPPKFANSKGEKVLVAQVGWAGTRLGRIDVDFQPTGGKLQKSKIAGKAYKLWSSGDLKTLA